MNSTLQLRRLIAPALLLVLAMVLILVAGFAGRAASGQEKPVAQDRKVTVEGVIVKRDADTITVRDARGSDVVVTLTNSTEVKEKKINPFRRGRNYATTQLLRGLNVQVSGKPGSSGGIVADEVKFKDDDLRMTSSVQARVDPIETRLTEVEGKLVQSEQNAQRLSGQVEEVSSIAKAARSAAKAAQDTGDAANVAVKDAVQGAEAAKESARAANERISSLDDYEVKGSAIVRFSLGSSTLTKEAHDQLDALAKAAKAEKGYMIEVTGFASSEGDEASNERLSQRRADAVVRYLTESQEIPLRRLITPFGFGTRHPVADNATLEGRKQNRRVEVKILVSRGLGGQIAK